ncbi:hypothetical protein AUP68_08994 [Ilyonectria robusta]
MSTPSGIRHLRCRAGADTNSQQSPGGMPACFRRCPRGRHRWPTVRIVLHANVALRCKPRLRPAMFQASTSPTPCFHPPLSRRAMARNSVFCWTNWRCALPRSPADPPADPRRLTGWEKRTPSARTTRPQDRERSRDDELQALIVNTKVGRASTASLEARQRCSTVDPEGFRSGCGLNLAD